MANLHSEGGFAMPTKPKKPEQIPARCLTVHEVAGFLHVHPATVRRMIKDKRLKKFNVGRHIRIDPRELHRVIDGIPA
jgi:excisionase family DNA binding protein